MGTPMASAVIIIEDNSPLSGRGERDQETTLSAAS